MNYQQQAQQLVKGLKQRMGPSPYDIAWLARLRVPGNGAARWPDLVEWLLANQRLDGSWGGEISYYHDRIICTLAAMIALHENSYGFNTRPAVQRAEKYLWNHLPFLSRDPYDLVGFELLFPTLLKTAQELKLNIPANTCGYGQIRNTKLGLIPPDLLYSPNLSTVHSLEFLGGDVDPIRLSQALAINGSLGNSPATTAYSLLMGLENEQALAYLNQARTHQQEVIYLYPFAIFELIWVLDNLDFCGLPINGFASQPIWESLRQEIEPKGIGLDPSFGIPDGDITSVCSNLLMKAGYPVRPAIMANFQHPQSGLFRTYLYERNLSVSTNVHALETLELMGDYPGRCETQQKIVEALLKERKFDLYWDDKWHISPYYCTAHAVVGLLPTVKDFDAICRSTIDWLIYTQRANGSWGFFENGTAEETAYALIALLHYHRSRPVPLEVLQRGVAYLQAAYEQNDWKHPEMWIGKCLYIPLDVVRSAILAALILYEECFGPLP